MPDDLSKCISAVSVTGKLTLSDLAYSSIERISFRTVSIGTFTLLAEPSIKVWAITGPLFFNKLGPAEESEKISITRFGSQPKGATKLSASASVCQ